MATTEEIYGLLQAGDAGAAARMAREGLQQGGEEADMLLPLSMALQMQGQFDEAAAGFERLTELRPGQVSAWGNYATALRSLGRLDEARTAYRRALKLKPDNPAQWFNLGSLQLQQGDALGARDSLLKAHALQPELPLFRIVAARALCDCQDYRAAGLLEPWRDWLPLPDDQQYDLANVMQLTDWTRESVDVLQDLLRRSPMHVRARLLLAALYERVNRLDEAKSLLDELGANAHDIEHADTLEIQHQQAALLARDAQYEPARAMLEGAGVRYDFDASHWFQLGNVCDRLDDDAAAMSAFGEAHRLQIETLRQTAPQRFVPGACPLPAAEHSVSADEYARWPALAAPDARQSPVFVVGFPRSGTTLLEQMLDAHPDLQSMDEWPFLYLLSEQLDDQGFRVPQELAKLGQSDCDELRKGYSALVASRIQRRPGARLVDKNPLNMLWLPMIHRLFPDARFILMLRHPCDALLSNYMQDYRSAVLAAMSVDLESLAGGYVTALQHWMHHVAVFNPNVLTVRYEQLVADPATEVARIGRFLELDDPSPMLAFDQHARGKAFVGTPSYTQVIEPISQRRAGRWLRYRPYFASALPVLEPILTKLGYTVDAGHASP